jgi:hypothetical protein
VRLARRLLGRNTRFLLTLAVGPHQTMAPQPQVDTRCSYLMLLSVENTERFLTLGYRYELTFEFASKNCWFCTDKQSS